MKQLSLFPDSPTGENTPYLTIQGTIPIDIPHNALLSIQRDTPLKVYSLGFQPAKSIPEIAHWFLKKYGTSSLTVLEPFAGSGTTILECLKYGASIHWTDYNPLSRLICQVKTQSVNLFELQTEGNQVIQAAQQQKNAPETVHFANKDFWFQKAVQEALELLKQQINQSPLELQSCLKLAYATTVRKMSDMNDGMILAAKRPHIEKIPQRSREDVFACFHASLGKVIDALSQWQPYHNTFHLAQQLSSVNAKNLATEQKFDAVVTSPPYINAIDYVWACKFELHWLEFVKTNRERLDLYSQEIGTERIPKQDYKKLGEIGLKKLDNLIANIYYARKYKATQRQNQLRARVVYQYFKDLKQHLKKSFHLLNKGGYYCFVVGEISTICGVEIPVASLLREIALEIGFVEDFCFHIVLKNRKLNIPRNVDWAKTIKHDTIVVLKK